MISHRSHNCKVSLQYEFSHVPSDRMGNRTPSDNNYTNRTCDSAEKLLTYLKNITYMDVNTKTKKNMSSAMRKFAFCISENRHRSAAW